MLNKIFVTTPCLNAIETLDRTIQSVVTQAGDFFIRYHVQDGGSTDGTLDRLNWWQRRLAKDNFPTQCLGLEFTFASAPDNGMYDGLCTGFDAMRIAPNSFMTWINADDTLMQGAFAFISEVERQFKKEQVSWVGGAASVFRSNIPIAGFDNPVPTLALQHGVCDGKHWNFLQQEGTFFRNWLWKAVAPDETVRPMQLAGDWNLWRQFAQKVPLAQTSFTLGNFRIEKGQLSERFREKYRSEMEKIVSSAERKAAMEEMAQGKAVFRHFLRIDYSDSRLSLVEEGCNGQLSHNYHKIFGEYPNIPKNSGHRKIICKGDLVTSNVTKELDEIISFQGNILAYDHNWQFPAITEQHAFHRLRDLNMIPDTVTYVAYPWANLIDKLQTKARDAHIHLRHFRQFCRRVPKDTIKITVCQHIKAKEFLSIFREAGISEIFWSHATHADVTTPLRDGIRFHPFPLYPVQISQEQSGLPSSERPYLFSFIGARSNHYYLTSAREWIIDFLADHPNGLIVGRDSWHYNKVVYEHQILPVERREGSADALVDLSSSEQFKSSLAKSIFSLCPSGSGPNSIRLWESIGAGAIPVILADTWAPPGDSRLWELAVVFCKETQADIRALPNRLVKIAAKPERLLQMRHAMRQLWLLYGPHNFVNDIQASLLARNCSEGTQEETASDHPPIVPNPGDDVTARKMLLDWSSRLLLAPTETLPLIEADLESLDILGQAQKCVGMDDLSEHFQSVLALARKSAKGSQKLGAPTIQRGTAPKICLFGRHSNRTPFSYAPIRRVIGDRVAWVKSPEAADIILTGFNIDFRDNAERLLSLRNGKTDPRFVVMSEEPLWDVTWSGPFTGRNGKISIDDNEISYLFLNHETSDIFNFEDIPYFVLTDDRFALRYSIMMSQHAEQDRATLLARWASAPIQSAFFVEYRKGENYAGRLPERDIFRLSQYRTEVAEASSGDGVLRVGKGWGEDGRRQDLPDWHLDKLAHLYGRSRMSAAYENVHQKSYISEKIFDAFAVGSIPTYWASPSHRIFELVPEDAMVNTFDLKASDAAHYLADFDPDPELADAWLATCSSLRDKFRNLSLICSERRRVAEAALKAISEVL